MMDLVDHLYILATYDQKFTFQDGECHVLFMLMQGDKRKLTE
ncbi:hypothetical protein LINPERHAP2_LOCUS9137 [Linum perenne]